jgi:hypothetical protein
MMEVDHLHWSFDRAPIVVPNITGAARKGWPRQVKTLNNEMKPASNLLAELREAYRNLPRHMQVRVAVLLRESAHQEELEVELAS